MRRRKLRKLWERLKEIAVIKHQSRDDLLMRLGGAKKQAGRAWYLVKINVPAEGQSVEAFSFKLNLKKLRQAYGREGCYLLRASIPDSMEPQELWRQYIGLSEIEASFKTLKGDLAVRPIHHQLQARIQAHIFVSFLAYCLHVALRAQLRTLAGGLTPRAVLEKLAALQMIDVHFPTTEGGKLVMPRYTQPDQDLKLLLARMGMDLPEQPPPRIEPDRSVHFENQGCGADF